MRERGSAQARPRCYDNPRAAVVRRRIAGAAAVRRRGPVMAAEEAAVRAQAEAVRRLKQDKADPDEVWLGPAFARGAGKGLVGGEREAQVLLGMGGWGRTSMTGSGVLGD